MSTALVNYRRKTFGGGERSVLFRAKILRAGVCFALREKDLIPEGERRDMQTIAIREVGYQHNIWSEALAAELVKRNPGNRKIYLREHGPFLVLASRPDVVDRLPPPGNFYRIDKEFGPDNKNPPAKAKPRCADSGSGGINSTI